MLVNENEVIRNERSFTRILHERSSFRRDDESVRPNKRMNERLAQVRIISRLDRPTDPDLTALTPFPALMTHRAVQLGFRANGTKSSARDLLNPGSTLMLEDTHPGTITSLALTIKAPRFSVQ